MNKNRNTDYATVLENVFSNCPFQICRCKVLKSWILTTKFGTSFLWRSAPCVDSWIPSKFTVSLSLQHEMQQGKLKKSEKAGRRHVRRSSKGLALFAFNTKDPPKKRSLGSHENWVVTSKIHLHSNPSFPVTVSMSDATSKRNNPAVLINLHLIE